MTSRLACLILAVMLGGCTVRVASLPIVAPHPVGADVIRTAQSRGWREGASCRFWILGVPFGLPKIEEAMDAALRPVGGAYLRSATLYSAHPTYVVYGWHCYLVHGEAYGATEPLGQSG